MKKVISLIFTFFFCLICIAASAQTNQSSNEGGSELSETEPGVTANTETDTNLNETTEDSPFQVQQNPATTNNETASPPASDNAIATKATNDNNAELPTPEQKELDSNINPKNFTTQVSLRGLNKITARTSPIIVKLGESVKFGNLNITLHACWKSPPEEEVESKALLEVWEEIPREPRKKVFSGWMFASSPLISAPEHPVYDITVLECKGEPIKPQT